MTDNQHPITPPPELVQQWLGEFFGCTVSGGLSDSERYLATQAARWGADQELEACCEWLEQNCGRWDLPAALRDARRSEPPSLEERKEESSVEPEYHPNLWSAFNGMCKELF